MDSHRLVLRSLRIEPTRGNGRVNAPRSGTTFAIPSARRVCASGLNFFLVVQSQGRGYWAGPVRPQYADGVVLVIEKYAGLSSAAVRRGGR